MCFTNRRKCENVKESAQRIDEFLKISNRMTGVRAPCAGSRFVQTFTDHFRFVLICLDLFRQIFHWD